MRPAHKPPNLLVPNEGPEQVATTLDFTGAATIFGDVTQEFIQGKFAFAQSVYIDNADNTAPVDLTLFGAPIAQRIRAQANSQGWYPLSWPVGAGRYKAASSQGQIINVIFANHAMPYSVWGPASGVTVVPPLTNFALNALNYAAPGDKILVAGVLAQTVKLYRGIFSVDSPAVLTWTDGAGGTVLFAASLTAGGSVTFQPSGIPWFVASVANSLVLHSSAACNVFGGFGVTQS